MSDQEINRGPSGCVSGAGDWQEDAAARTRHTAPARPAMSGMALARTGPHRLALDHRAPGRRPHPGELFRHERAHFGGVRGADCEAHAGA